MILSGILGRSIDLDRSAVLYDRPFSARSLAEDFFVAAGDWCVEDGWLVGRILGNAGGFVYTRGNHPGDVVLEFRAALVPPCTHDLNFAFRTEGWDDAKSDAGRGYIGGLSAWYDGKSGIERYPDFSVQAMTSILALAPGQEVLVQTGLVDGRCFLFVDGALVVDLRDPSPIADPACGRVGLGVFFSQARFRDLRVLSPFVVREEASYAGLDRTAREEIRHG